MAISYGGTAQITHGYGPFLNLSLCFSKRHGPQVGLRFPWVLIISPWIGLFFHMFIYVVFFDFFSLSFSLYL